MHLQPAEDLDDRLICVMQLTTYITPTYSPPTHTHARTPHRLHTHPLALCPAAPISLTAVGPNQTPPGNCILTPGFLILILILPFFFLLFAHVPALHQSIVHTPRGVF